MGWYVRSVVFLNAIQFSVISHSHLIKLSFYFYFSCIIHTDPDSDSGHARVHIMVSYLQSIKQNNSKYI